MSQLEHPKSSRRNAVSELFNEVLTSPPCFFGVACLTACAGCQCLHRDQHLSTFELFWDLANLWLISAFGELQRAPHWSLTSHLTNGHMVPRSAGRHPLVLPRRVEWDLPRSSPRSDDVYRSLTFSGSKRYNTTAHEPPWVMRLGECQKGETYHDFARSQPQIDQLRWLFEMPAPKSCPPSATRMVQNAGVTKNVGSLLDGMCGLPESPKPGHQSLHWTWHHDSAAIHATSSMDGMQAIDP